MPGGLDGFNGAVRATDQAGNSASTGVGPIDGSTPVPVITGANGAGLQGTAEAGAAVALLDADGDPVLDAAGNPIVVTAGPDGVWTVPVALVPGGLNGFIGSVSATDAAGNTAATSVGPVDGSISVSVNVDPVTADNVINIAEAASGSVTVSGTAFGDVVAGASITITLSNGASQTTTLAADGSWSVGFPGSALANSTTVTAVITVTDSSGNTVTVSDVQPFTLDLTPPAAPVITGANGGGLSGTATPGVTITLYDAGGTPITSTVTGPDGRWTVPAADVPGGLNGFTGSVQATDPAGNTASTGVGPVDGFAAAPAVDTANGAGLSGTGEPGNVLTLLDANGNPVTGANGQPVTTVVRADGTWTIDAGLVPGGLDGFAGSVLATDAAGNSAGVGVGPVDGQTPTPVITGANGAGLSGTAEPGAIILLDENGSPVIGANGQPVQVTVAADGTWTIPATAVPGGLDGFTGSVRAVDPAGNVSATAVGPIDGTVSLSLSVNVVTADNVLNLAESQGTVTLTGRAVGDFTAGQTITLTFSNGAVLTTTLAADGSWTVGASGAMLAGSTSIVASTTTTDTAGNTVTVSGTRTYGVDLIGQAPVVASATGAAISGTAEPGARVDLLDPAGGVIASVTAAFDGAFSFPASVVAGGLDGFAGSVRATDAAGNPASAPVGPVDGSTTAPLISVANGGGLSGTAEAGATVTLLDSSGNPVVSVTAGAGGVWTIPGGSVPGGLDGFNGAVRATDQSGNSASTGVGPIDGSTPVPVITGANGAGLQGTAEAGAAVALLDADGDPVLDAAGDPIVVTAGPDGVWTVPVALVPGGLNGFIGSVSATDAAGNTAATSVGPVDGSISVSVNVDPVTADNVINIAEAASGSVTVSGTAFGDVVVGASITITLSNGASQTTTLAADGSWSVGFPGSALANSTTVTAVITVTDSSGNTVTVSDVQPFTLDLTPPAAPVITGANGGGLSGTATPGVTITLYDAGGTPITSTVTGPDGRWTVPAADVPGGLNGFTGSVQATDPAGNTASTGVGLIDGTTEAPVVTASNGAGITGTAEAGATITLLDTSGNPVLDSGGDPITVVADGGGIWTIPGADIPGGSDGFTGTVLATDPAGNTATGAVGPVDGLTPAPIITAANGAGVSGTAEAGATITLLDGAGNPVLDAGGDPVTVVVGASGTWTIPASDVPGGLNGFSGQVAATDPSGNTAATSVGPIDGSISLTLVVNAVTADNVINGAEAGQASLAVTGRAVGEFTAGQALSVTLSTGQTVSTTLAADGSWSVNFPGATLAAATSVTATTTATDSAGNSVTVSDSQSYAADLSTLAPTIVQANGAGLSGTAEAGARITIRNAGGQTVGTAVADNTGAWTLPAASVSANLNGFIGSIQATDAAGNSSATPVGPVDGAVSLLISVNPITTDNVVNISESGGLVAVSGQVTGEFRAGDVLTLTLTNGVTQTVVLGAGGTWTINVAGADLAASNGLTASVLTTDAAGNTANVAVNAAYGVDLQAPTAPTLISAGAAGISGSGEAGATVQLLDAGGLPVTGAGGQPITAVVGVNGTWTISPAAFAGGAVPSGFTGQLVSRDPAGNVSTATTVPLIDLTPPNGSTTTVAIDVIAGDDIVNIAESQGPVIVTGRVTGEFRAGDVVTVTAGAQTFTGTVAADGRWSIPVAGAALAGGALQATVQASDAAGNIGSISASRPYTLDILGPGGPGGTLAPTLVIAAAADGLISPTELSAGVSATVGLTASAQAGDTVTLTIANGGTPQVFTRVLSAADITAGQVTFSVGSSLTDGQYTAVAIIRDPSGNVSTPSTTLGFAVDAVAIGVGNVTAGVSEAAIGVQVTGSIPLTGATGPVTFALQSPGVALTSEGQPVTWAIAPDGALVGTAGGRTIVRAVIDASGQYRITLLDSIDHPGAGADTLQIPIGVTVTDSDGSATGVIGLTVTDSVPQLPAPVVLNPTAPGVIVGDLVNDFGADGGRLVSVTIDGRTFTYNPATDTVSTSGSATSILAFSVDDGVLSLSTARGEAITVDFDTGDYRIQVTGQSAAAQPNDRPQVALGGGEGLLGLVDADVLGLIQLDRQQFFTASDANNDIGQVVVRYSAAIGLGLKTFSYNAALAAELGLVVVQANTFLLPGSSQLTITAAGGGAVDNLKLNEFLASISISGGLSGLLDLNVAQTLSIQATDLHGNVTLDSESTLADLGVLAGLLGSSQIGQIVAGTSGNNTLTASDVGTGAALDNRMYGYDGNDTLNAGLGNDILRGGRGNDTLNGGAGNDLLIGGIGNDVLNGGAGVDLFRWERGDQGTTAQPAADTIQDFNVASVTLGGDVLDFSSLLIGEGRIGNNPGNLANYIHFEQTASGTVIHLSTTGAFVGGFGSATSGAADQTILLSGVNLTAGFGSDQAILADLLARGKLVVDNLDVNGSGLPPTLVIGGSVVDGDGDTGSTSVTVNTGAVAPTPPIAGNVAPVVQASAQTLLGLIGLGALGLNLNSQDLLAGDANGNLSRVELEYSPLVALNLTPLTFSYSAALASAFGLQVQVTQSAGLLGIVAPSARIVITSADGGVIDNLEINRFLESIYLSDSGGGLLSSSLLSVNLLNAMTLTAVDAQGLSSSAVIGSVLNVNLLNSLDGPDPVTAVAALSSDPATSADTDWQAHLHSDGGFDFGDDMIRVPSDEMALRAARHPMIVQEQTPEVLMPDDNAIDKTALIDGKDAGPEVRPIEEMIFDRDDIDGIDTLNLPIGPVDGYDTAFVPSPILPDDNPGMIP